ncbi:phage terminase small subunit P27 family [Planococcus soli]|uniref:phage terminase small subunit P27 family n=1 Tax=Planococcus soli TaxID=2666072 RepID=UPI00115ECB21|nr:phage terminase small subunit P27 family [Planococcus soli]
MARKHVLLDNSRSNFTKEEMQRRLNKEKALKEFAGISKTPPTWLSVKSKKEYKRIVPLLEKLPIAALDQTLVVLYCQFYSVFLEASENLKECGLIEAGTNKPNPSFNAMVKASSEIRLIASQLGMTIDSRMKLVVPEKEELYDPFKEMLEED